MARKLATKAGAARYAQRKTIVEPVFGQMHTVQDARRLRLRGKPAARAQWRFHCAIHNLLKLHRNGGLALITHRIEAPRRFWARPPHEHREPASNPPATPSQPRSPTTGDITNATTVTTTR